jgi:hypothetical protein
MEPRGRLSRAREGLVAIKLQKLEAKKQNKKRMHAMMCYMAMYYPCDQAHSLHETNLRVNRMYVLLLYENKTPIINIFFPYSDLLLYFVYHNVD